MQGPNRNIQSGIKYKYYQACEEKLIVSYFYFLTLDLYFYWSSSLTCTCLCGLNDMDVQFCPKDFLINRLLHFVGKYENFFKLSNSIQRYSDNLQINYSITHIIIKKNDYCDVHSLSQDVHMALCLRGSCDRMQGVQSTTYIILFGYIDDKM